MFVPLLSPSQKKESLGKHPLLPTYFRGRNEIKEENTDRENKHQDIFLTQWLKNHFSGRKGFGERFPTHRDLLDLSEKTHLWPLGFDCAAWGFICVYAKGFVGLQADVSSPSQFLWLFLACFCTHLLTCLFCSLTASLTQL